MKGRTMPTAITPAARSISHVVNTTPSSVRIWFDAEGRTLATEPSSGPASHPAGAVLGTNGCAGNPHSYMTERIAQDWLEAGDSELPARDRYAATVSPRERLFGSGATGTRTDGQDFQQRQRAQQISRSGPEVDAGR